MNFFTTERLLEYLTPEGLERASQIANLQDILMALDKSNIEYICDYFIKSIFLRNFDLIQRFVDNIFVCCKYREFYVDQYAFLIYALHQTIRNATRIQSSVNLGFQTKENIDKSIFTFHYLTQTDQIIKSYVNKDLMECKNDYLPSRRKSLIIGEIQGMNEREYGMTENENQILSIININTEKINSDENNDEQTIGNEKVDPEFDLFFNEFIMNSNSILSFFRDRVFTINQSVTKQEWRLYCIYKCIEIFNNDGYYHYIQDFYENSLTIEIDQMMVFAYFAPQIKSHNPSLFSELYKEMNKRHQNKFLPHSFNDFFTSFEYSESTNWKDHGFILENCGFRADSPLYAIRHDDVTFFILNKEKRKQEYDVNSDNEIFFSYNMRVKENIYLRYRQLQFHCTLLQLAAYYGSEKCFSFLLDNGADPSIEDDIGLNVMHFAVIGGSNKIIQQLQLLGYSFDIGAISLIVESYRLDLFQWILSVIEINLEESFLQTGTIFHRACSSNNILIILFCISNYVNVNVFDNLELTPLFYAASNRSIDAINVLLSHKDINWSLADKFKDTPLHGAAKSFDCDTFIAVMNHKDADINVRDFKQRTAFRYAIGEGKYDIVRMIIEKYGDIVDYDETDINGQNLGFSNSYLCFLSTFIIICNWPKIDLNMPRNDGLCLLHSIVSSNLIEFAKVILDQERTDPNVKLPNGTTPLHIASKQGFTEIVQLLINNEKTDVNVKDGYGLTPIHYAIKHIKSDAVKILVNCEKVDLNITAVLLLFIFLIMVFLINIIFYLTPLEFAKLLGRQEIIDIIAKFIE